MRMPLPLIKQRYSKSNYPICRARPLDVSRTHCSLGRQLPGRLPADLESLTPAGVNWTWTDAWVLTAAYLPKKNPVTLTELFAAGDAVNKAIFTDDEVQQGLMKLSAAELLQWDGKVIALTEKALRLCDEAVESTQYILQAMKTIEEELRQIDLTGAVLTPIQLDTDAVHAALTAYHKRPAFWWRAFEPPNAGG
jgi:hypothetical protein